MSKLIFLLFLIFGLFGCAGASRKDVEKEVKYHPISSKDFSFNNKDISFEYVPIITDESLEIKIKNLTSDSIKIDWDKSAFIDIEGNSGRIIHSGVKYNERNNSQVPTSIPPKGKITDALLPADHIQWSYDNWWVEPICGKKAYPTLFWEDNKPSCFKGELGIFIAYEINGKSKNFTVKFKAERLKKEPKK